MIREPEAARLYPSRVLEGCESALILFAAAWHGKQDAVWIADAGLTATCVDTDWGKLAEMERLYPDDWEFLAADAFDFALALYGRDWYEVDVVSLDPFTSLIDRCAAMLDVWCSLARRAVILGTLAGTEVVPPEGWRVTERVQRSSFRGGVYWTVVEPC